MDEFEYFVDDGSYDNESIESDSGISTGSSTISSSTSYEEPTDELITDIMKEINSQNPLFIREMIVFSINGALAEDTKLSSSAVVFLWKLFKLTSGFDNSVTEKILTHCPELLFSIKSLVLDEEKSKELLFYVSGIYYYASKTKIGSDQILESSIDALLCMMNSDIMSVVHYSFTCIHNVLLHVPKSRELISKNYDLSSLIQQLSSLNGCLESRLELITVDILSRLATKHEANKKILLSKKILHKCLHTVMTSSTTKVIVVHSHMIRVLSTNPECKEYLLNNLDFIRFLICECQQVNETHTNRIFWSIILNISDKLLFSINGCQMGIPKLINRMVQYIKNYRRTPISVDMVGIILCCLSNFSCHQDWVKDIICKRGVQYIIVELLKIENKSNFPTLSVNVIEACYRCLNHIMTRLLAVSDDFLLKNYQQILPVLDHLKLGKKDDLYEKLIQLSINESNKMKLCNQVEYENLITPIRSWIILMTHIVTIETTKYAKRKSCQKDYETMMKTIKYEVKTVTNFLTSPFIQKQQTTSEEEKNTFHDILNHLNTLVNIKPNM